MAGGICVGAAYPGGRSDDCIKIQIFPSGSSGWSDQVLPLYNHRGIAVNE